MAREGLGLSLASVVDRTGVPWRQLEGLEAGNLAAFPDERSIAVALRRYSDMLHLDPAPLIAIAQDHWETQRAPSPVVAATGSVLTAAGPATGIAQAPPQVVTGTGHLSRYPGDQSHLQAFTQTGPVPGLARPSAIRSQAAVAGGGAGDHHTGVYPAVPGLRIHELRPKPPLVLRMALWTIVVLLVVGVAGLAIHRWHPQWLKDLHVMRTPAAHHPATTATTGGTAPSTLPVVQSAATGMATGTVTVRAAEYQVVVVTTSRVWVQVSTPAAATSVFAGVMGPGQTQTFTPAGGRMTVLLGASGAQVTVKVNGSTDPGWRFSPAVAPYTLTFVSTSS